MKAAAIDYAAWTTRLLIYIAGVVSTVVGSWISSKIRVYHDARNSHRDELKQKILLPLYTSLHNQFDAPDFDIKWGEQRYNTQASAQECPAVYGPVLIVSDPGQLAENGMDEALLEDARTTHHRKLTSGWDAFRKAWAIHLMHIEEWIAKIANELLQRSRLPAHPNPKEYIMQLDLAAFILRRLFGTTLISLSVGSESNAAILSDGSRSLAKGSEPQIRELLRFIESLLELHRNTAADLQRELTQLLDMRTSLSRQFGLQLAAKKLSGRCVLVPFF